MSVWPHLLAFDLTLKKGWARGLFMRGLYKVLNRELKFLSHPEENVFLPPLLSFTSKLNYFQMSLL